MSPKHMILVKESLNKLTMPKKKKKRRKHCDYFPLFSTSKDAPGVLLSF